MVLKTSLKKVLRTPVIISNLDLHLYSLFIVIVMLYTHPALLLWIGWSEWVYIEDAGIHLQRMFYLDLRRLRRDTMAFHILCSFEIAVNSSFKIQDFTYSHYAMIVPNLHEKKTAIGNQREACQCVHINAVLRWSIDAVALLKLPSLGCAPPWGIYWRCWYPSSEDVLFRFEEIEEGYNGFSYFMQLWDRSE